MGKYDALFTETPVQRTGKYIALFSGTAAAEPVQPTPETPPPRPAGVWGTTGTYSVPAEQIGGGTYGERVQADIEQQAETAKERVEGGVDPVFAATAGGVQSMAAHVRQAPGVFEAGQAVGALAEPIMKPVAKFAERAREVSPPPATPVWTPATPGAYVSPPVSKAEAETALDIAGGVAEIAEPIGTGIFAKSKFFPEVPTSTKKAVAAAKAAEKVTDDIKEGLEKGLRLRGKGKSAWKAGEDIIEKGNEAVGVLAEHKDLIELVDKKGKAIKAPRNAMETSQAIHKTKEYLYPEYTEMADAAAKAGGRINTDGIVSKLKAMKNKDGLYEANTAMHPRINRLVKDMEKLNGADPTAVQRRIEQFNKSLGDILKGSEPKALDISVVGELRKLNDEVISEYAGAGYSDLRKKYGALLAIEKEVNREALRSMRRPSGWGEGMKDAFTGEDITLSLLTQNPAFIARGVVRESVGAAFRQAKNTDKHIKKMFESAYKEAEPYKLTSATPEKTIFTQLPEGDIPAYRRKGVRDPETKFIEQQAERRAVPEAIRKMRPKETEQQRLIESIKRLRSQ